MAGSAKLDSGRLLQKEDAVRSMGGMTGFTISFQGVLGLAVSSPKNQEYFIT
jgi:hypothetical protein